MSEQERRFRATALGETIEGQGRSKRWVAAQVGIHETLLAHFISGRRSVPESTADAISKAIGVPFFLLFESAEADNTSAKASAA